MISLKGGLSLVLQWDPKRIKNIVAIGEECVTVADSNTGKLGVCGYLILAGIELCASYRIQHVKDGVG